MEICNKKKWIGGLYNECYTDTKTRKKLYHRSKNQQSFIQVSQRTSRGQYGKKKTLIRKNKLDFMETVLRKPEFKDMTRSIGENFD